MHTYVLLDYVSDYYRGTAINCRAYKSAMLNAINVVQTGNCRHLQSNWSRNPTLEKYWIAVRQCFRRVVHANIELCTRSDY